MQYTEAELRKMATDWGVCRTCYQPIIKRQRSPDNIVLVGSSDFENLVESQDTCEAGHTRSSTESRQLTPEEIGLYVDMMLHFIP